MSIKDHVKAFEKIKNRIPLDNPLNDEYENLILKVGSTKDFKDQIFMNIANEIAKMSKCITFHVGSVIVKDGRIISIGYNGTPKGFKNCNDVFDENDFVREEHHKFSEAFEIHSELNSLLYASRNSMSVEGATMYCTLQPCLNCLKNICQSGLNRVVYRDNYDSLTYSQDTLKMLETVGITIDRLETVEDPK